MACSVKNYGPFHRQTEKNTFKLNFTFDKVRYLGLTNAYAKGAKLNGASILEDCPVSKIDMNEDNSVRGVTVGNNEKIYANKVVIAGGAWARDIAKTVDVEIPIMVNKHSYVVSEIIPGISAYPNLRMYDYALYFKVIHSFILLSDPNLNSPHVNILRSHFVQI